MWEKCGYFSKKILEKNLHFFYLFDIIYKLMRNCICRFFLTLFFMTHPSACATMCAHSTKCLKKISVNI